VSAGRVALALLAPLLLSLAAMGCASSPPYARCGDTPCAMGGCYAISLTRDDGTEASGSFCTNTCTSDDDCPDEGACIALAHDREMTFLCVDRCEGSSDCYAGFACTALTVDGRPALSACLP
jgi:hypothetical protein